MSHSHLSSIGQLSITIHDLARAVNFYREALGLQLLFEVPPSMAFFDCGGVRLMLAIPEKPELDHPSSIIYFRVDDIQAAYTDLSSRGVPFEGEPHVVHKTDDQELWMAALRDPEGNLLALMHEKAI